MHLLDRCQATNGWATVPAGEKLVFTGALLVLIVGSGSAAAQLAAFVVATTLTLGPAGIHPRDLVLVWLVPLGFVLTGAAAQLVVLDPWGAGPLLAWDDGGTALATLVRSLAAVSALLLLVLTTPLGDLLAVLHRWRVPAVVLDLALLMLRLIRLLVETVAAGHRAQALRLGHDGARRRLRSAALLGAALLPRTLARAARLQLGLALRGDQGQLRLRGVPPSPGPMRVAAGCAILAGLLILAVAAP